VTEVIDTAQKALHDLHQRRQLQGSWTLTDDEAEALHEEGIAVLPLPFPGLLKKEDLQ
jgi:hypothetical protein